MIGRMLCRVRLHRYQRVNARDGDGVYARCRRCGAEADFTGVRGFPAGY